MLKKRLITFIVLSIALHVNAQPVIANCPFANDLNLVSKKISCGILPVPENHNLSLIHI